MCCLRHKIPRIVSCYEMIQKVLNKSQIESSCKQLALWPGLAIMLAVLGLNLLGNALGDLLDPRRRAR